jgi:transcriptional regulator with XRE-family HTH domain
MIGEALKRLRKTKKMTQDEVAVQLGFSRTALSQYENNLREPDYDTLIQLAQFYQVDANVLFGLRKSQAGIEQIFDKTRELSDDAFIAEHSITLDGRRLSADEIRTIRALIRLRRSDKPD